MTTPSTDAKKDLPLGYVPEGPDQPLPYREILGKLNIVTVSISKFNGYIKRDDVETDDLRTAGSFKITNPAKIRPFNNIRSQVERLLNQSGISMMKSHGVPDENIGELATKIKALIQEWNEEKEKFIQNYQQDLVEWAEAHPEDKDKILQRAPKVEYIRNQIQFYVSVFKVSPLDEATKLFNEDGNFLSQADNLYNQLVSEIAKDVRDTWKKENETGNGKTIAFLGRILKKMRSLSFIDPKVNVLTKYISETLRNIPNKGVISGDNFLILHGLLSILSDETRIKKVAMEMSFIDVDSNPENDKGDLVDEGQPSSSWNI